VRASAAPPDILAPLALVERDRGAMRLATVDRLAAAAGVVPGMTLADARARLPELVSLPHDPAADAALVDWLAEGADRYTPMVEARGAALLLDVTGCLHRHTSEAALADEMVARLARLGFTALPAFADTPDAALALAVHQCASVADLPVTALAATPETHTALRRAGLLTIGALARRQRAALAARFGPAVVQALAQLTGEIDVHIVPRRMPAPIGAERRFAAPLTSSEAALKVIESLAVRVGIDLAAAGQGGRSFAVALFRSDGHVDRLSVETAAPTRDARVLVRLLRERIGALADPLDPGFGYDLIRLDVPVTAPLGEAQLNIAGGSLAEAEVGALVDRLVARLGRGRVRRLVAADSHIPEQAAFDLPIADGASEAGAWAPAPPGEPCWRPVKLFDPPQPIDVVAEVPDGPPRRFFWRRRSHDVVASEGPERIAAEWWRRPRGTGLTRDYFRVEDGDGRRYWLFRHGLYGTEKPVPAWFIHGVFA